MPDSIPEPKKGGATIWLLGSVFVIIVVGATVQERTIIIAAADSPPSISTPATGSEPSRTSQRELGMREQAIHEQAMHEQGRKSGPPPPFGQPGTQIYYGGWNPPQ
jgi:hypothetical protein